MGGLRPDLEQARVAHQDALQPADGGRQDDADVGWHDELRCHVPPGLVQQQHGVPARLNLGRDGFELQVHLGIAPGQDEADGFALRRTDGAEDIGRCGTLI
jgi:hypothetical protein